MKDAFRSFKRQTLPAAGAHVQVLCNYRGRLEVAPFLCGWTDQGWIVAGTRRKLGFDVVGWRYPIRLLPPS